MGVQVPRTRRKLGCQPIGRGVRLSNAFLFDLVESSTPGMNTCIEARDLRPFATTRPNSSLPIQRTYISYIPVLIVQSLYEILLTIISMADFDVPVIPPPHGVFSDFGHSSSQQNKIISVNAIFIALAVIFTSLQFYTRLYIQKARFRWEEGKNISIAKSPALKEAV